MTEQKQALVVKRKCCNTNIEVFAIPDAFQETEFLLLLLEYSKQPEKYKAELSSEYGLEPCKCDIINY